MSLILADDPAQQRCSPPEASLKTRLEAVRTQLRLIGRDIQATEGRFLDFNTAETLQRALYHTTRQLDAIATSVAIIERERSAR
jgi:hypothetical protein